MQAAFSDSQFINRHLSDFPMNFYPDSVFKQRLHHGTEHHSLSRWRVARPDLRFRFYCVKVGIDPPGTLFQGNYLHEEKIHRAILACLQADERRVEN